MYWGVKTLSEGRKELQNGMLRVYKTVSFVIDEEIFNVEFKRDIKPTSFKWLKNFLGLASDGFLNTDIRAQEKEINTEVYSVRKILPATVIVCKNKGLDSFAFKLWNSRFNNLVKELIRKTEGVALEQYKTLNNSQKKPLRYFTDLNRLKNMEKVFWEQRDNIPYDNVKSFLKLILDIEQIKFKTNWESSASKSLICMLDAILNLLKGKDELKAKKELVNTNEQERIFPSRKCVDEVINDIDEGSQQERYNYSFKDSDSNITCNEKSVKLKTTTKRDVDKSLFERALEYRNEKNDVKLRNAVMKK